MKRIPSERIVELAHHTAAEQKSLSNDNVVTEDSAALAFADRYQDLMRFDHDIGKWFVWSGSHWQAERTGLAFSWARDLVREMAEDAPNKTRLISSKVSFAGGVEKFARTDRAFAVTANVWDRDLYLLGTPGGTVDLRTGELRPAAPADFITKQTAVAPADKPDCPRWHQFLREATNNDDDLIAFLQQFCGYALTGDIKEHALMFIHGTAGTGKSKFQNTVAGVLADYCATATMEAFTASPTDRHTTEVAMLRGARLVIASETEEGRAWAEARIKRMTGGDPITARFMRQDNFTFMPQFKLLLIGNHKPALRNVDDAARRRFNIVPFIHKPPIPDLDLEDKLRAEWPGILRWMIDGCLNWQRRNLVRPQVVLDVTSEYFEEQDLIRHWINEHCETGKVTLSDTSSNLFKSWSKWATENGEKPGTSVRFAEALQKQGFTPYRTKKARGFRGIEARPEPAGQHWSDTEWTLETEDPK